MNFKKLDTNRKQYSVAFFLMTAIILVCVNALYHHDILLVLSVAMLVAHLVLSVLYWFKGLAFATMGLVVYLLLIAGIGISVLLYNIPLPGFINKEICSSIANVIFLVFIVVIPLPKYAKQAVERKLNPDDPKFADASDLFIERDEKPRVSYDTYSEYRAQANYLSKSYSLAYCSPFMRRLRMVVGVVLFGVGLIGLLVAGHSEDGAVYFYESWVFWLIAASFTAFIMGSVIFIAGFLRSLLVPAGMAICIFVGYTIYQKYLTKQISVLGFGMAAAALIALLVWAFIVFLKHLSSKNRKRLAYFERDNSRIGTDLILKDVAPVEKYSTVIKLNAELAKNVQEHLREQLDGIISHWWDDKRFIFAGSILDESNRYEAYLYSKNGVKLSKRLVKQLKIDGVEQIRYEPVEDGDWKIYLERLYPDSDTLTEMNNEGLISALEFAGLDLSQEQQVVFTAIFESKNQAIACQNAAKDKGFIDAVYTDHSELAEENKLAKKYYHSVGLLFNSRLGLERVNMNCKMVNEFIKEFDGEFNGWEIIDDFNEYVASLEDMEDS